MIKNILISILVAILLLIVIISYGNKDSEKITLSPQVSNFVPSTECTNPIDCYERALQDLKTAEQQIVRLQGKTEEKAEQLQQRIEALEKLIDSYNAELSKYTETQKVAFDQRLEKALRDQLITLTMQYEEKIRQDYTQQMRQLIQKLQRINQADALFQFQDRFLEGVKNNAQSKQYSPMMIIIPEGQYTMGYVETTDAIDPSLTQKTLDETAIKVTLKRFAISQHEVTVSNYARFLNDIQHESHFKYHPSKRAISYQGNTILSNVCEIKQSDHANCSSGIIFYPDSQTWQADTDKFAYPITSVSWYGARAYTNWLSQQTGFTYRLPTQYEWEYVARADSDTLYWWGNKIDTQNANFNPANMIRQEGGHFVYRRQLLPVDSLLANPWGLYHVHGNASEWTCSPDIIERSRIKNWQTCSLSETRYIIRGGSWRNAAYQLRSTYRRAVQAITQENDLTFRLVREL